MSKHRHKKEHEKEHGKHHFKRGGRTGHEHHEDQSHGDGKGKEEYDARGSHVVREAESKKDAFKHGGKVMGHKSKARMDKYARGGRAGGSPFSSAKIKENTAAHKG